MIIVLNKKYILTVTGMHCSHCKAACEKAALSVAGVKKAIADPKANQLVIKTEKTFGDADVALVIAAVENCGFKASLK